MSIGRITMIEFTSDEALKAAQKLMSAIEKLTSDKKYLPRDIGGKSTTKQITKAMIDIISGKNS